MQYTVNDVLYVKRKRVIETPLGKKVVYKGTYATKDGKYNTEEDTKAFSYWYDEKGYRLGNRAYDYCFFCEGGFERAVELLNKLLIKYEIQ